MDYLVIVYVLFLIYYSGVALSMLYILFWNMECHSNFSDEMKEIDVVNSFKSWYFFAIKHKIKK